MPSNIGVRANRGWRPVQELVVESLVVALAVVVLDVLPAEKAYMPLAERDAKAGWRTRSFDTSQSSEMVSARGLSAATVERQEFAEGVVV